MLVSRVWPLLLWLSCLAVALVSWRFLLAPLPAAMPHMAHYLPSFALQAYGHVVAGPIALAIVPFQLWQGLRQKRPTLHRTLGYVYVAAVLVAALASLAILLNFRGSLWAASGFLLLALLWIAFTLQAVAAARSGDYERHRRWMLRSIALTFAAVTLRAIMAPLIASGWSVTETYEITAWGSWVLNLCILEWCERRRVLSA